MWTRVSERARSVNLISRQEKNLTTLSFRIVFAIATTPTIGHHYPWFFLCRCVTFGRVKIKFMQNESMTAAFFCSFISFISHSTWSFATLLPSACSSGTMWILKIHVFCSQIDSTLLFRICKVNHREQMRATDRAKETSHPNDDEGHHCVRCEKNVDKKRCISLTIFSCVLIFPKNAVKSSSWRHNHQKAKTHIPKKKQQTKLIDSVFFFFLALHRIVCAWMSHHSEWMISKWNSVKEVECDSVW